MDNNILLEGKVNYKVNFELLRDNQENYKLFNIKKAKIAVDRTNELLKNQNTTFVEVSYLSLNDNINVSTLLSELYYRNSQGNSHADVNSKK